MTDSSQQCMMSLDISRGKQDVPLNYIFHDAKYKPGPISAMRQLLLV